MTRVSITDLSSVAGRYVRMDGVRASFNRPGASLLGRAVGIAFALTLALVALVVMVPLVLLVAAFFLVTLVVLQVRRLVGRWFGRVLPRNDGRRNVRVRLPSEAAE